VCVPDVTACGYTFNGVYGSSKFSPKLAAEWTPAAGALVYASYTRGFRAGGYNVRTAAPATPLPYLDETVDAYEIGEKAEFFDRRLRLNSAVFYNRFDNLQRQVIRPGQVGTVTTIFNAAAAVIKGVESEVVFAPTLDFKMEGSVGYTDAHYKSFVGLDLTGDGIPDPALARNLKLERAPEWTYSIAAEYGFDLGNDHRLTVRGDYSYTSSYPAQTTNTYFIKALDLVNATASLRLSDNLTLSIFGKNLFDKRYFHLATQSAPTSSAGYLAPPRTFGVTLAAHY
jgi:outer membrane receptor protein involved in Fe transport